MLCSLVLNQSKLLNYREYLKNFNFIILDNDFFRGKDVIGLGGVVSKQPSQTTHLVVDKIERTAKLLKCLSTCENIVSIKWIIDSKLNGKFMDPTEYQVKDEKFEKHYNCCLKESLERAKTRRPIFYVILLN